MSQPTNCPYCGSERTIPRGKFCTSTKLYFLCGSQEHDLGSGELHLFRSKLCQEREKLIKLEADVLFYKDQWTKCVDAVMWMHDDPQLKRDIPIGHSLTISGPTILKKQRDDAQIHNKKLCGLIERALEELPAEAHDNYQQLHDEYNQLVNSIHFHNIF